MKNEEEILSILQTRQRELEEALKIIETQDPTALGSDFDRENTQDDDAAEREGKARADALKKKTEEQLVEVARALEKIKEGTYGICDICGKPIDPARLEMMPEASLCLDDQKLVE